MIGLLIAVGSHPRAKLAAAPLPATEQPIIRPQVFVFSPVLPVRNPKNHNPSLHFVLPHLSSSISLFFSCHRQLDTRLLLSLTTCDRRLCRCVLRLAVPQTQPRSASRLRFLGAAGPRRPPSAQAQPADLHTFCPTSPPANCPLAPNATRRFSPSTPPTGSSSYGDLSFIFVTLFRHFP